MKNMAVSPVIINGFKKSVESYIRLEEFPFGKAEINVSPSIVLNKQNFKKICIIQLSTLGDIVETTPVLNNFKKLNNNIHITFVVFDNFKNILLNHQFIDEIIAIDFNFICMNFENNFNLSIQYIEKILEKLNYYNFDLSINLHPSKFSAFLNTAINSERKIGLQYDKKFEDTFISGDLNMYFRFFKFYINKDALFDENNVVDMFLKSTQFLEYDRHIVLQNPESNKDRIDFLKNTDELIIGICFSAAWKTKIYPAEHFNLLIKLLNQNKEFKFKFILFGNQNEINDSKIIEKNNENIINLTGKISLNELINYIYYCDYIITNDTGTMHIASAFNKKMVVILGATNTKPIIEDALIISLRSVECKYCFKSECNNKKCLNELKPNRLSEVILKYIRNEDYDGFDEILLETTNKFINEKLYSTKYLNYKIKESELCFKEGIILLFQNAWEAINQKLYYENNYKNFAEMILNSKIHSEKNIDKYNEIAKILNRKFDEQIVRTAIENIEKFIENNFSSLETLLKTAIDISKKIYNAVKYNEMLILNNIKIFLDKLDGIDAQMSENEYYKKFFDLITVIFYNKNTETDFQVIAYNNLKLYEIKLAALQILKSD